MRGSSATACLPSPNVGGGGLNEYQPVAPDGDTASRAQRSPPPLDRNVRHPGMHYHDGTKVALGDIVNVPIPGGTAKARVVMLGVSYEHLDIDAKFLEWVKRDKVLKSTDVILEWIGANPFAHNDPRYAPVGNYMYSPPSESLVPNA